MRTLRLSLAATVTLALLGGLGGAVVAQEASPEPSPEPSPAVSPAPLEAEAATEPLPVADYWGEWSLHKNASRARVQRAIDNAKNARAKKVGFYRTLVSAHNDEMLWLANHQPEACYAAEYERWRAAVEELHALAKKSVDFARKGDASGLKRLAKERRAAVRELDRVLSYASDCVDSEPIAMVPANPFAGKWIARPVYVRPRTGGHIDRSPRRLSITAGNRMLLRIARDSGCIWAGYEAAPLTIRSRGQVVAGDTPIFTWPRARVDCYPKGKGRVKVADQSDPTFLAYSAPEDVLLMGAGHECYWRKKDGSPKDCKAFWRGTPAKSDPAEPPAE